MRSQKGYIALTTVLIIMAVVLSTVATVTLLSIGEAQSGLALFKGEDNLNFVEGCVEDVMLKIRSDSLYNTKPNSSILSRPEGTCTIAYNATNPNWDITVSSQDATYQRKIQVLFTRNPTGITLTSWQEIP